MKIKIKTQGGSELEFEDMNSADKTIDFILRDGDLKRRYQIDKSELKRALRAITTT